MTVGPTPTTLSSGASPQNGRSILCFPGCYCRCGESSGAIVTIVVGFILGFGLLVLFPPLGSACPWYVGLFAMGMIAADWSYGPASKKRPELKQLPWGWASILFLIFLAAEVCILPRYWWGAHLWALDLVVGALATSLILYACQGMNERHPTRTLAVLQHPVSVGLGGFSYSLYLTHVPVLAIGQLVLRNSNLSINVATAIMLCVFVPACVLMAFLFYLVFERPFVRSPARASTGTAAQTNGRLRV